MKNEDYQKELEKITAACADLKRRMDEPQDVLGALQDIRRRLTGIKSEIKDLKKASIKHNPNIVVCQCSDCIAKRANTSFNAPLLYFEDDDLTSQEKRWLKDLQKPVIGQLDRWLGKK